MSLAKRIFYSEDRTRAKLYESFIDFSTLTLSEVQKLHREIASKHFVGEIYNIRYRYLSRVTLFLYCIKFMNDKNCVGVLKRCAFPPPAHWETE